MLPKINQTEWNVAKYQETNEQTLEYDDKKETNQNERKKKLTLPVKKPITEKT